MKTTMMQEAEKEAGLLRLHGHGMPLYGSGVWIENIQWFHLCKKYSSVCENVCLL